MPLPGRRVLIVDDNQTNRRVLEEMSIGWGMRPVAVDGGPAALASVEDAWVAGEPYEVVLLDVRMPEMDGFAVAEAMGPNPHMAGATIVMLTSDDRAQEQARCEALGLSAYMVKPITKRDLLRSLQRALRRRDATAVPLAPLTRDNADGPAPRALRVLVAEDNEVNVRLTVALLTKLGHAATVVGDGQAAVEAHARELFDLILMDVQMPVLGGLDATRLIREAEAAAPHRPHVPIVALTARAMKGDREECLAAGMDDYVTKPVRLSDLAAAFARQVPGLPRVGAGARATRRDATRGPPPDRMLRWRRGRAAAMNLDLRPLTVSEFLDRTFSIYRHRFLLFVALMAPQAVLSLVAALAWGWASASFTNVEGLRRPRS